MLSHIIINLHIIVRYLFVWAYFHPSIFLKIGIYNNLDRDFSVFGCKNVHAHITGNILFLIFDALGAQGRNVCKYHSRCRLNCNKKC